jgi:hypothetical protein
MKIFTLLPLATMALAVTIGVFENFKNGGGQFAALATPPATCSKTIAQTFQIDPFTPYSFKS